MAISTQVCLFEIMVSGNFVCLLSYLSQNTDHFTFLDIFDSVILSEISTTDSDRLKLVS